MQEMFNDYDNIAADWNLPKLGDYLRQVVINYSGCHLGYSRQILNSIWSKRKQMEMISDADVVEELLSFKFHSQIVALRSSINVNLLSTEERFFLIELLSVKEIIFESFLPPHVSTLIKKGVVSEKVQNHVVFSSDMAYRGIFMQFESSLCRPSSPPNNIVELILSALPFIDASALLNTLGKHKNSEHPLEDSWQKEIYKVITHLVPSGNLVSSSVGQCFSQKKISINGAVDFYIDGVLKWMVELTSEGSDLGMHVNRFEKGGEYENIPRKDWLVVDFRSSEKKIRGLKEHILYVCYEKDFSCAHVTGLPLQQYCFRNEWTVKFDPNCKITTIASLVKEHPVINATTPKKRKKIQSTKSNDE